MYNYCTNEIREETIFRNTQSLSHCNFLMEFSIRRCMSNVALILTTHECVYLCVSLNRFNYYVHDL